MGYELRKRLADRLENRILRAVGVRCPDGRDAVKYPGFCTIAGASTGRTGGLAFLLLRSDGASLPFRAVVGAYRDV